MNEIISHSNTRDGLKALRKPELDMPYPDVARWLRHSTSGGKTYRVRPVDRHHSVQRLKEYFVYLDT